jgi:glycosyltransferase involved in cell wall biosynthesis
MKVKVLLIGPSISKTRGGMATVISDLLRSQTLAEAVSYKYLASHSETNQLIKIIKAFNSWFQALFTVGNYDILHIHAASGASFFRKSVFVLIAKAFKKKSILHVHSNDFDTFYSNSNRYVKSFIRFTLNSCSSIIVLSQYWKLFFDNEVFARNVYVLPNGVDPEIFKCCLNSPDTEYRDFLFLGRLGKRKGIYDLLAGIDTLVHKENRRDIHFYLAGDGEIEKVAAIIKERNLEHHVSLSGWIENDDKLIHLYKTQTLLLPSYHEGLPLSILEGMACGKTIISTKVGGIPELVTDYENGFLISPGNVQELTDAIRFILDNPELPGEIAKRNIAKIAHNFNLSSIHEKVLDHYKRLVNDN